MIAQPVPIQATTSVAAYVTAPATEVVTDAAAAAQELAIEVLSTLASLAQPVPIQATTSVAAYVTAPATKVVTDTAAAAQEIAIEVLSTLVSLEEERTDAQAEADAQAQAQAYAAEILKNYTPPPRKAQRPSTPVDPRISEIAAYDALAKINRC